MSGCAYYYGESQVHSSPLASPFAFRELSAVMAGTTVELTREQASEFVTEVPPLPIAAEHAVEQQATHAVAGPVDRS